MCTTCSVTGSGELHCPWEEARGKEVRRGRKGSCIMAESVCGHAGWDVLHSPLLLWLYWHLQEAGGQLSHKVLLINTCFIASYHHLLHSCLLVTSYIIYLTIVFFCPSSFLPYLCKRTSVLPQHLMLLLTQAHLRSNITCCTCCSLKSIDFFFHHCVSGFGSLTLLLCVPGGSSSRISSLHPASSPGYVSRTVAVHSPRRQPDEQPVGGCSLWCPLLNCLQVGTLKM